MPSCQWLFLRQRLDRDPGRKVVRRAHPVYDRRAQSSHLGHTVTLEAAVQEILGAAYLCTRRQSFLQDPPELLST